MNILFAAVGDFLTIEAKHCLAYWRAHCHIVEQMPIGRVPSYLKFESASSLALVDVIVCMADSDRMLQAAPKFDTPLEKALALAKDIRSLPHTCAMRD
jgi:hypothetical protein